MFRRRRKRKELTDADLVRWAARRAAAGPDAPTRVGHAYGPRSGGATELERSLWRCPRCGDLYLVNWVIHPDDTQGCDHNLTGADGTVTETEALALTGWTEKALLLEAYCIATNSTWAHPHGVWPPW